MILSSWTHLLYHGFSRCQVECLKNIHTQSSSPIEIRCRSGLDFELRRKSDEKLDTLCGVWGKMGWKIWCEKFVRPSWQDAKVYNYSRDSEIPRARECRETALTQTTLCDPIDIVKYTPYNNTMHDHNYTYYKAILFIYSETHLFFSVYVLIQ